jgi:GTP-binding protein HflX
MIHGNLDGIRDTILDELENLYKLRIDKQIILDQELVDIISKISFKINREISVAIDRRGYIQGVAIGDSTTVQIPLMDIKEKKLSGLRIIHTHPGGNSRLSAIDLSALIKLKLDSIVAIGVDNETYTSFGIAFCAIRDGALVVEKNDELTLEQILSIHFIEKVKEIDREFSSLVVDIEEDEEKAILVGCDSEESLMELKELAEACEVKVLESIYQKRSKVDTAYYIGSGKAQEVSLICQGLGANLVIFDDELSGSHVKNLEETIGLKVIDRTTLILEIFAKRAKSREAKLQVELAQLKYRLPRLMGLGTMLSRTGGGIGTKGPGEKKLETDRRHIRERVYDLLSELAKIKKVRSVQRERRIASNIPVVSLIGYTNAGKSTLRNKLCEICAPKEIMNKESVFEADMLFATLDTTTRAIVLKDNQNITLTDTVGFVRKLPHDLVEAFKSTLEEVIYSDVLVHVVDSSNEEVLSQIYAVEGVIEQLGVKDTPIILALNKVDKVSDETLNSIIENVKENSIYNYDPIVLISAKKEINLDKLTDGISERIGTHFREIECLIPYADSSMHSFIHRNANIIKEDYKDEGYYIKASVDDEVFNKTKQYHI